MFGSVILDVAIGLILVYLLMSLLCSAIREALEGWLKTRSVHLERGIRELLHDPSGTTLASDIYNHPLVQSLYKGEYNPTLIRTRTKKDGTVEHHAVPSRGHLPSYIPSGNFALALLDVVARGPSSGDPGTATGDAPVLTLAGIRARIGEIQNPPVQRALLAAIDTANGDLTRAQKNVEAWFDSSMDRVSGWYKRRTQLVLFLIGLVVAVVLNVDSFGIAQFLYRDKPMRDALVAQAATVSRDPSFVTQPQSVEQIRATMDSLRLPIGWARDSAGGLYRVTPSGRHDVRRNESWTKWVGDLVGASGGWLATAFAVSFGAPFWFDLLNKVMVVRSTVKPHEKSPEESSEDRQSKNAAPPPHLGGGGPSAGGETGGGGGGGGGGGAPSGSPPDSPEPPQGSTAVGGPRPGGDVQPPANPGDPGADFQPQEWAAGNPQEGTV
ncbi:MAG TPA: hypothetical protein VLK84_22865 [Longimicrobium sp.]|nr:hypothetical protein [Longimicrobium sp.]